VREKILQAGGGGGQGSRDLSAMLEAYEKKFGLDQPLWKQYLNYMNDLIHLDLGFSIANYPTRVSTLIASAIPWTIGLMGTATLIAFVLGSLLGAYMSWPGCPKWVSYLATPLMTFSAVPYYILSLILIYIVSVKLKLLPVFGGVEIGMIYTDNWIKAKDIIRHGILPALSIILVAIGGWALSMRGMMVTTQGEDFMINAEAKGLKARRIFFSYGLRNALLPQVTNLALALATIVSSSVLVELAFGYPGIGGLLSKSVQVSDYNVIYGVSIILVLSISFATFLVDLMLPLLDPRVKIEEC
jgi:peptide/nickel transport system permease protein